jgi:uncharacterized protein YycO
MTADGSIDPVFEAVFDHLDHYPNRHVVSISRAEEILLQIFEDYFESGENILLMSDMEGYLNAWHHNVMCHPCSTTVEVDFGTHLDRISDLVENVDQMNDNIAELAEIEADA